ncbi:MAG: hypothetical protein U1E29_04935, partial [Coriobacteriia bacterium]|nr:hypothetical protein [Coriobacteriia bacterium]
MTTLDYDTIAKRVGITERDAKDALRDFVKVSRRPIESEDVAVKLLRWAFRVFDPSSLSVEGPPDWRAHSRSVLAQFSDDRRRVLGLFGFASPLGTWRSITPLVQQMCDDQNAKGRSALLRYPFADGEQRRVGVLRVFEGRGSVWDDVPIVDGEQVLTDAHLDARP